MIAVPGSEYLSPAIALVGAVFGGVGVKYVDKIFVLKEKKSDLDFRMRDELKEEIKDLRVMVKDLDARLDLSEKRYYMVLIKYNMLREKSGLQADLEDPDLNERIKQMISEIKNGKPSGDVK